MGAAKWQLYGIGLLAGVLLLLGTWLHGRHDGIESEKERANGRIAVEQAAMIEHMAEYARVMGQAVRAAHERENEQIERRRVADQRRREAESWREAQIASDAACAAWAAAPVGCRLLEPTDGGDSGQARIPGAPGSLPAATGLGQRKRAQD